ncbi:MAG: trigger factor, partial [Deltaproteobacteria bacterium]|nr:trigger factor [Deltaproteobacteria bacterium]
MSVKVENVSSVKKKISFAVAAEKVDREINKAFKKIGKNAKVKGFRTGKIPLSVLEKYYGVQVEKEVLTELINQTYFEALSKHEIPAIGDPSIVDSSGINRGEDFTYVAEVEIKPEIKAQNYTGLELEKEKFVADPKVVDSSLEDMRSSRAEVKVTSRKVARQNDVAIIDFQGYVDDEPFEGGAGEDYQLELGSGMFIPGFEEQVVGMKRNEEKKIEITFPSDYGQKELAGKNALFLVTLKEIKEKVLPDLDDDFAKGFGEESLDTLKAQLIEHYRTQEQNRIDGELREQLIKALIKNNQIDVPEAMIQGQLDYMLQNITNRLQSQGLKPEMLGLTPETFKEQYRQTAIDQVQGSLLLEAIGT